MLESNYEIIAKLLADPSGDSTMTPDYVVEFLNSESCVTCLEKFIDVFEGLASGPFYRTNKFGSSANTIAMDTEAKEVPTLILENILTTEGYSNITLTFNLGEQDDKVICTAVEDIYDGDEELT